jgi:hypothetical protein
VAEIAFPGEARRKKFQWLSKAGSLDGEGVVLVQLHDELKPFLLASKKDFAPIPLLESSGARSSAGSLKWSYQTVFAFGRTNFSSG